jgi:hypothetical protein
VRRTDLEYFIWKRPEVGLRLVDLLAERLRLVDERMSDIVHKECVEGESSEVTSRPAGLGFSPAPIGLAHNAPLRYCL